LPAFQTGTLAKIKTVLASKNKNSFTVEKIKGVAHSPCGGTGGKKKNGGETIIITGTIIFIVNWCRLVLDNVIDREYNACIVR